MNEENVNVAEDGLTDQQVAFREYRDSIPKHLWLPELGEGFFKGWDAALRLSKETAK